MPIADRGMQSETYLKRDYTDLHKNPHKNKKGSKRLKFCNVIASTRSAVNVFVGH
jgi:hypothetical protein